MGGPDRGSWFAFRNRSALALLVEHDPRLKNVYAAIVVDGARHPDVKAELAGQLVTWLVSDPAQAAIGDFRVEGQQLFFPIASGAPGTPAGSATSPDR